MNTSTPAGLMSSRVFLVPLVAVVYVALGSGCSTPPQRAIFERESSFGAPFDTVWRGTIDALEGTGFQITDIEKESGVLVAEARAAAAENWDCGTVGFSTMLPVRTHGQLTIRVSRGPEGVAATRVRVDAAYHQVWQEYSREKETKCESSGAAETAILSRIAARLQAAT